MRLVFISSTFKDMQSERDQMHNRVLPLIDAELEKYGEELEFADLRWGVNTKGLSEEDSSRKVLSLCLDRIDDCRPYMIVFIGERYGWIPEKRFLEEICRQKEIDLPNYDGSVTELEIEYGALLHPDFEGRILFYFRDEFDTSKMNEEEKKIYCVESDIHKEKINKLKAKIEELYPNYIRHYQVEFDENNRVLTGFDKLNEMVYSDLLRIFQIDIEKEEAIPYEDRFYRNSDNYLKSYAKNKANLDDLSYVGYKDNEFESNVGYTYTYTNNPVLKIIYGEEGKGVRTQLSLAYKNYLEAEDNVAIPLVLEGETDLDISALLIYKFEQLLKLEHSRSRDISYLLSLLNRYEELGKDIYIFVYSTNTNFLELLLRIEALQPMDKKYFEYIHFHFGYRGLLDESKPIPYYFLAASEELEPIYETKDKRKILLSMVERKKKELSKKVVNKILKKEASDNLLYMSLVVDRLCMFDEYDFKNIRKLGDGMEAIEKYMLSIVDNYGDDLNGIIGELFSELCQRINPISVPYFISLLSYKSEFSVGQIGTFLKYHSIPYEESDFILFTKLYPTLIQREDSFYSFSNQIIKEEAKRFKNEHLPNLDEEILVFLESFDYNSKFYRWAYPSYIVEIKDKDRFIDSLVNISSLYDKEETNKENLNNLYISFYKKYIKIMKKDYRFCLDIIFSLLDKIADGINLNSKIAISDYLLYPFYNNDKDLYELGCKMIGEFLNHIYNHQELINHKAINNLLDYVLIYISSNQIENSFDEVDSSIIEWLKERFKNGFDFDKKDVLNNRIMTENMFNIFFTLFKDRTYNDGKSNEMFVNMMPSLIKVLKDIQEGMTSNQEFLKALSKYKDSLDDRNFIVRNNTTYFLFLVQLAYIYLLSGDLEASEKYACYAFEIIKEVVNKYLNEECSYMKINEGLYYLSDIFITVYEEKSEIEKLQNYYQEYFELTNKILSNANNYYVALNDILPSMSFVFSYALIEHGEEDIEYIIGISQFLIKSAKTNIWEFGINRFKRILKNIDYYYINPYKLINCFIDINNMLDLSDETFLEFKELLTDKMFYDSRIEDSQDDVIEYFEEYFE
ncbi:MAG: DUF4062 domain-containing protein [Bacilli bacterium]|nr:DUF4062 domain-containing protein [Bacilli bacterium]